MKRGTIMRFIIHNKTLLFLVLLIVVSCSKKQELLQSDLYLTQKTIINPFENVYKRIGKNVLQFTNIIVYTRE